MIKRLLLLLIIAHVIMNDVSAQKFKDGLYITANDFINQTPILKENIWIGEYHPKNYSEVLSVVRIECTINNGRKKIENVYSTIFGYYEAEKLSIIFEEHQYSFAVTGTLTEIDTTINVHGGGAGKNGPYSTISRVKKHIIFNAKTGKTVNVDEKTIKELFKKEKDLLKKYLSLKKKERLEKTTQFISEYNLKYPL